MIITNDQYRGIAQLEKWYHKYQHQFIEVSGVIGTGSWMLIQKFIENIGFDPREVMYLSYDQKQVLELAAKRYHAYYINGIIYKYTRYVNFNSLPVINPNSNEIEYKWKKEIRKKIDSKYKLIIIFDSILLDQSTIEDLSTFELPIILIKDPMLLPSPDSYTYSRFPNISLLEPHPELMRSPITYFAHKILRNEKMIPGNYDTVSIVTKKQMNLYNLRSSNMTITTTEHVRQEINHIYRTKIMKLNNLTNVVGERVIVMNNLYGHKLVNQDEKHIKLYLTKGLIGYLSKCNKHALSTKYVSIDFKPEFYFEPFTELYMDRNYLNGVDTPSRQQKPDEILKLEYAYALSAPLARLSHWDKVTMIMDVDENYTAEFQRRLFYTAITRAKHSLTIVI